MGCKTKEKLYPTYNKSAYSLVYDLNKTKEYNRSDSIIVNIEIKDTNSDSAYIASQIKIGCNVYKTKKNIQNKSQKI